MDPKFSKFEAEVDRLLNADISIKNIINYYKKPPQSIYNAIKRIKKKKNNISQQEGASRGRISKVSPRTKRAINRDITRSPKKQKKRLISENNLDISSRTLQRVLKNEGWTTSSSKKKAILDQKKAKNRLLYAKKQLKTLSNINFDKIIFSDESGIQRGHGSRSEYSRKRQNKPQNPKIYSTKNKSKFKIFLYYLKDYSIFIRYF